MGYVFSNYYESKSDYAHYYDYLRGNNAVTSKQYREQVLQVQNTIKSVSEELSNWQGSAGSDYSEITKILAERHLAFIPILWAGLGMVEGVMSLMPTARVGHIGLYRDPKTLKPIEYYCKLPSDINERDVIVMDPMLEVRVSVPAWVAVDFAGNENTQSINTLTWIYDNTWPNNVILVEKTTVYSDNTTFNRWHIFKKNN